MSLINQLQKLFFCNATQVCWNIDWIECFAYGLPVILDAIQTVFDDSDFSYSEEVAKNVDCLR